MPRFPAKTKARLYADLSKYARSGFGIQKACESMLTQRRLPRPVRWFCEGLLNGLHADHSFAKSLDYVQVNVTSLEKAVIDAAERGGSIEQAFDYLASYFKSAHETRRKILRGLIYPLILLHFALIVSVLGTTVFSSFSPTRATDGVDWSIAGQTLKFILWIYLGVIALILLAIRLFHLIPSSRLADSAFTRIPIWGSAIRTLAWERFCSSFALFVKSGLKISDGFRGAGKASQSAQIHRVAQKSARRLEEGENISLSTLFQRHRIYPADFSRGISAADETGRLDEEFDWWADHFRNEARDKIDLISKWTPKLFYFAILILVAWLVIRVALSYYQMLGEWIDRI